jgi:hypothetical protein
MLHKGCLILTPEPIGSVPFLNSEAADSMPQVADSGPRMNEPSPILDSIQNSW